MKYNEPAFLEDYKSDTDTALIRKQVADYKEKIRKEYEQSFSVVEKMFVLSQKPGSKTGWYYYKTASPRTSSYVEMPVSSTGCIYFKAHYMGKKIDISRIEIQVRNKTIPFYDKKEWVSHVLDNEKFHQTCSFFPIYNNRYINESFLSLLCDVNLIKSNENVIVTFIDGDTWIKTTLSQENINELKNSWLLSQFLSFKSNNYYSHCPLDRLPFLVPKDILTIDYFSDASN